MRWGKTMKKFKRITGLIICAAMILATGSCNNGDGRNTEQGADTTTNVAVTTTEDPNKDIDIVIDYDEMADIDTVD